MTDFITI